MGVVEGGHFEQWWGKTQFHGLKSIFGPKVGGLGRAGAFSNLHFTVS